MKITHVYVLVWLTSATAEAINLVVLKDPWTQSKLIICTINNFRLIVRVTINCVDTKCLLNLYFWAKYDLEQKYYAPQVRPDWGSNS